MYIKKSRDIVLHTNKLTVSNWGEFDNCVKWYFDIGQFLRVQVQEVGQNAPHHRL